jgi:hypothetical protein
MRQVTSLAVALVVLAGCRENSPLQQNQPILNALIFDGAHSDGNKDFFFLPPLVGNPNGSPNFDAGKFNAHLSPFVEVCELSANPILFPTTDCNASKPLAFGPARMSLDAGSEQYQVNWDTKASLLDATRFYRITVRGAARGVALGFLDVDPVLGGMKNVKTGDVYAFQDGRTLPIKVRIEQGAFGSGNATDRVEQVVPNIITGGTLDITTNTGFAGARFSNGWLPLGIDQVVVIIERVPVHNGQSDNGCLNIGLEELEGCYRFRTDPDLHGLGIDGTDLLFRIPVIAGVCFQIPGAAGNEGGPPFALHRREEIRGVLTGPAEELEDVPAPFLRCDGFGATPPSIGAAFRSGRLGDLAKAGLYAVTHTIGKLIQPASLHAVDLGAGGSTNEFSRFGYARRASVSVTDGDGATAAAGSTIPAAVRVQNSHHDETSPVVGQSVTFTVTSGGGTVSTESCNEGTSCAGTTNSDGTAGVTWRLGAGTNTLQVSTNQVTNSPVTITATGTEGGSTVQTLQTGLQYPLGLWVAGGRVYLTETADHNTSFGGRRRLSRLVLDGGAFETLMDNPVNSDAVAVTGDGSVYLASYAGTSPGEAGHVSVAQFDIEAGWIETPITDVAIAAQDMFLDANDDIYLIGSSDSPTAASLYRLPAGNYASAAVLARALGRSWSITKIGTDLYYSVLGAGQVRRIGATNELVFSGASVTTLTSDGTYLFYGDIDGNLRRRNLSTGAVETLFAGPGQINAARYDAESQTVFFLRSGTAAAQYKDGSLNSIYVGPVIQ